MSSEPLVSVIIPSYNRENSIIRSVDSVLKQTYQNIELIVVDDGSTDSTVNLLNEIKDSRLRVLELKSNAGASAARNAGIKIAKGSYIAFHDSDDVWVLDKLKTQLDLIEGTGPDVGMVYSAYDVIYEDGKKITIPSKTSEKLSGDLSGLLSKYNVVGTPTMLVKSEVFKNVGMFDEKLIQLEDWDFALRVSSKYQFLYINTPLLISYYSADGVNANKRQKSLDNKAYFLSKNKSLLNKRAFRSHYKSEMQFFASEKEYKSAFLKACKLLRMYPCNLRYLQYVILNGWRALTQNINKNKI